MTTRRYALLIPVKDGRQAKSRLGVGSDKQRARLMTAFARDSISAAAACQYVDVFVVGDAKKLADPLAGIDLEFLPDEGEGNLNRAITRAASHVGSPDRPVAVLLADLPCLRTDELDVVFETGSAIGARCFVADAEGTGTTILMAAAGNALAPRFGAGSAAAHSESGATLIGEGLASIRLDVDTTADLEAALQLGVGRATAAATALLL